MKRATDEVTSSALAVKISIHALVKRATDCPTFSIKNGCISIHALVKRATAVSDWRKGLWQHFNPRLREEGDKSGDTSVKELSYFNPRPREEGDAKGNNIYRTGAISIHALVKRATLAMYYVHGQFTISIHALVKRATNIINHNICNGLNFNPRPREEGDVSRFHNKIMCNIISIHALVKRATEDLIPDFSRKLFQSTPS